MNFIYDDYMKLSNEVRGYTVGDNRYLLSYSSYLVVKRDLKVTGTTIPEWEELPLYFKNGEYY